MIIKNVFPYQFLVNVQAHSQEFSYPNYLKDLIKKRDILDFQKLEEFFSTELQNASVQNQNSADYFLFISQNALIYALLKKDIDGFNYCVEIIRHRMTAIRNIKAIDVNLKSWDQFLALISSGFYRLIKQKPIEDFEEKISNLDWGIFDKSFIGLVSSVIGFVYTEEDAEEQVSKSRIWLQKSINENEFEKNLSNYLFIIRQFLKENTAESTERISTIVNTLSSGKSEISDSFISYIFDNALSEIGAIQDVLGNPHFDDSKTRKAYYQAKAKDLSEALNSLPNTFTRFTQQTLEDATAKLYGLLFNLEEEEIVRNSYAASAMAHSQNAIDIASSQRDYNAEMNSKLNRAALSVEVDTSFTEKEMKEISQYFKKSGIYPSYIGAIQTYLALLEKNQQGQKSEDLLLDVLKYGQKKLENGGFYLIIRGLAVANSVFENERLKPGVSWMVHSLDGFFQKIMGVIDSFDEIMDWIGKSQIEDFRKNFIDFEPYSHFNIKVYYTYQLYQLKLMLIGAKINNDPISQKLSENMIAAFEDENNPLSFISADWDEFKNVPNDVRNKTLNKCINIPKGDLPLAAEHLDFSYRNLRSYITFKEVNRLGFFLNVQETSNRQLEQGIRLMFFDLYKKGTIFEVVFDMPKFLVDYADKGFYSQDLEHNLNIKGTTAKKYIKIMIQNNIIRQDKTTQRKHYYKLIKENVMNRLGKDQATLIR